VAQYLVSALKGAVCGVDGFIQQLLTAIDLLLLLVHTAPPSSGATWRMRIQRRRKKHWNLMDWIG